MLQHAGIGILLGAAIVLGNRVEGGVVAYQFACVLFLAPYAILALPVQTAIQPELTLDAIATTPAFAKGVRWAADSMALLVVPVSAAFIALAVPAMRAITVDSHHHNVDLLAAAIASLGIGLLPYSIFLLLARALYARGDSRTPAIVALVTACIGAAFMAVGSSVDPRHRGGARTRLRPQPRLPARRAGPRRSSSTAGSTRRSSRRRFPLAFITSAVLGGAAWALFHELGDDRPDQDDRAARRRRRRRRRDLHRRDPARPRSGDADGARVQVLASQGGSEKPADAELIRQPAVRLAEALGELGADLVADRGCPPT